MTRRRVNLLDSKSHKPMLIAGILFLLLVPAALLAARRPNTASAAWFDPNWTYRTKIDVANSSGSTQTDFQVLVATDTATLITAGKMQATCGDLRVTDNSGKLLNYWVEPSTCNTSATQIWVKVPSIPTSGIPVYLYYGNASASPATYKTTDVFIKELSGSIASWPLDDTTTTQSYARVVNATQATGRNIVINGTFDADVSWTKQTGWTIANGVAHHDGSGSSARSIYQTTPVIAGKYYSFTYTISNIQAGGSFVAYIQGTYGTTRTTNGTFTETILAGSTNANTNIVQQGSGAADIDNISVTQVNVPSSGTTANTITDGDMELSGVATWNTGGTDSVITKVTTSPHGGTQNLRVAFGSTFANPLASKTVTVGKTYRVYGWYRGDGTHTPRVDDNNTPLATGTTSTSWQPFDVVYTAVTSSLRFRAITGVAGYAEFDDVTVVEDTITRPGELMQDSNMDIADTSSWVGINAATLSKQSVTRYDSTTGLVLRITATGTAWAGAQNIGVNMMVAGKTYHVSGWYRGDGTAAPRISNNNNVTIGTSSTTWQSFDVVYTSNSSTSTFSLNNGGATTGYVEFDNVSITEISPLSGTFSTTASKVPTLGAASGGHLSTAYSFNAANSQYVNIYSSDLNSAFNPNEGTMIAWAKVSGAGVWTDGANREIFRLSDGGSNLLDMEKGVSGNNTIVYRAYFGGTNLAVAVGSLSSTGWFQVALTWSKSANQMKAYYNGSQTGSTQTGLGTWSANITNAQTIIGAATNTGSEPWSGMINDVHLFNRALSSDEIASLYSSSSDIQAYATNNYLGKELVRKFNSGVTTTLSYAEETSTGPAAYWKFDEGNGQTVNDSSTNKNNGTLGANSSQAADDPTWVSEDQCISGKCLSFNGSSTFVNIPNTNILNTNTAVTVSVWFKGNGTSWPDAWQGLVAKRAGTVTNYALNIRGGSQNTLQWYFRSGGAWKTVTTPANAISLNTWHHAECSFNTSGANVIGQIYLDGTLVSSQTLTSTTLLSDTNPITVGRTGDQGEYFNGFIDEIKIYPYARTAAQIQADYNSRGSNTASGTTVGLQSNTFLNNGLVSYWKMDEATWSGTANEVIDSSGNGNHGAAGGPTNAKAYPTGGKFGNAAYFDGVDDRVVLSTNTTPIQTASKTFAFWANPTVSRDEIILGNSTGNYYYRFTNTNMYMSYMNAAGTQVTVQTNAGVVINNSWHHYAFTTDVSGSTVTIKMYIDGVRADNLTPRTDGYWSSYNSPFYLGGLTATSYSYIGYLDDVRMYNRALSPSEVSALYNWAPGPYVYLPFDDGTGTTIKDTSGNGYSGAWNGTGSHWTTGKFGKAGHFDGTDDFVSFASLPKPANMPLTIEFWTKPTTATPVGIFDSAPGMGNVLRNYSAGRVEWWAASPQVVLGLTAGTWTHLAFIFDYTGGNQTITWYKNGVLQTGGSAAQAGTWAWTTFRIGNINGGAAGWYAGDLDEFKIYNYTRSQQQVVEDMNGGHPTGGSPIGSQLEYWKFDEGFGQTANNSISGAANAILGATSGVEASDPTWTTSATCKFGGCLSFSGTQYVLGGNLGAFPPQGAISFWMYPTTVANYYNPFTTKYNGGNSGIRFEETTAGAFYAVPGNDAANVGTIGYYYNSGMTANTWYHVVYVWNTTTNTQTGYINGKQVFSNSNSNWPTTIPNLSVGMGYDTTRGFKGYIDEVKVYSSALTADQVKIDYNAGASLNFGAGAASESASLSDGAGNSPIAYYDFEERSGTTLVDKSGNNYAGTVSCTGGGCVKPVWTTGKVGAAMTFDGVDDYVNLPVSSTFLPGANSPITVEGWFRPTSIGATNYTNRCVSIASGPSGSAFLLGFDNTNKAFFYTSSTGTRSPFSANAVLNQWTHLAVTYNGTQIQLYRDGKPDGAPITSTLSAGDSTTAKLGTVVTANNNWFAGQMDEVKIYNYARTASQIAYDYNRGGPVGWWQFDECQGSTLHDASGNGNDGTWAGGTSIGTCTTPSTAWGNGITGKYNSSLAFNSTNSDYVNIPDNSSLRPGSGDWAMAYWFKAPNSNQYGVAVGKRDPSTFNQIVSGVGTLAGGNPVAAKTVFVATFSPLMAYRTTRDIADGNWHHVVAIRPASGTPLIYIDGKSEPLTTLSAGSLANINNTTSWKIGWDSNPGTDFFNGQIDDVRLYNYIPSATQVKTLFNGGAAVKYGPLVGQP